ncbi:hypothetical protein LCGC14_2923590, partial [marine sediment metagenome]
MKTINVEKVHSKKIEYNDKNTGEAKSFIKYAAACEKVWYELKGFGKDQVKEGDTISGEYSTQDWESNGKTGTNHILALVDKTTADILRRVEDIEHSVAALMITDKTQPDE